MYSQTASLTKKISGLEKRLFPWKAAGLLKGRPAFFPGCNLVNFLPDTASEAVKALKDLGCGWMFDCCGKPLGLSGDQEGAAVILRRIELEIERMRSRK
jgi:fumarate reductase (CoM/CoB) subunit B